MLRTTLLIATLFHAVVAQSCESLTNCCDCLTPGKAGSQTLCDWIAKRNVIVGPGEDGAGRCVVAGGRKRQQVLEEDYIVDVKLCPCGDGNYCPASVLDKQCDEGSFNGDKSCCNKDCSLKTSGFVCRDAEPNSCDRPETCNGKDPKCPADGKWYQGKVCRAKKNDCDVEEVCNGKDSTCPADVFRPQGTVCRQRNGDCDIAELCDANGACPADKFIQAGQLCVDNDGNERVANGDCDEPDICDGNSAFCKSAYKKGVVCRTAAGPCDVEETCPGNRATCPSDLKRSRGAVCRAAADKCDAAEVCDGSTDGCSVDKYRAAGSVCRSAAGPCDVPEVCDGTSLECPFDQFKAPTEVCSAGSACFEQSFCTGDKATCPARIQFAVGFACVHPNKCYANAACDAQGRCDPGVSVCQCMAPSAAVDCKTTRGCAVPTCTNNECVYAPAKSGVQCRASKGVCDVAEVCDGVSLDCPPDVFAAKDVECRKAAGDCDEPEFCTSFDEKCPPDSFKATSVICRKADGPCDVDDFCPGTNKACPANAKKSVGEVCDDGDKCTDGDKCDQTGKCVPGEDKCECREDRDCIPLEEVGPNEDPCSKYKCLPDNTCLVTPYTFCTRVIGGCVRGTGGCQCGPKNICATPFSCNVTSGYCEGMDNPSCVGRMGTPGCPCDETKPCEPPEPRGKRGLNDGFIRCQENLCRVQVDLDPPGRDLFPTCQPGSDGCRCRDKESVDGQCNAGLECKDEAYCTIGCEIGSLGCACHIEGSAQCRAGVCRGNRCVLPETSCTDNKCKPGELGCCCDNGECKEISLGRKRVAGDYIVTIGAVCIADRCVSEQVSILETAPPTPMATEMSIYLPPACTPLTIEDICQRKCSTRTNVESCDCVQRRAKVVCKTNPSELPTGEPVVQETTDVTAATPLAVAAIVAALQLIVNL